MDEKISQTFNIDSGTNKIRPRSHNESLIHILNMDDSKMSEEKEMDLFWNQFLCSE